MNSSPPKKIHVMSSAVLSTSQYTSTRLQNACNLSKDGSLIWRQINDTIRDYNIDGIIEDAAGAKVLDETFTEFDIRASQTKGIDMEVNVGLRFV
jgi:hypothetical protein